MSLNAELQALTLPANTEFPGTPQALLALICQYVAITGLNPFNGINYGPTEPTPENRDKPWFKTDSSFNPIGWYSWGGASWEPTPITPESGTTVSRPTNPTIAQLYYDTDIRVLLMWTGAAWVTADGSPGDIKEVKAATLADAITNNPGWVQDTDSIGKVIVGALADGSDYGTNVGADAVTIDITNLPGDTIKLASGWAPYSGSFQNGPQPAGVFPIVTGQGSSATSSTGPINPDAQVDLDVRQASRIYFRLVKS
jgi:hypothetical protein